MSLALSIAPVLLLFGLILITPLGAIASAGVSLTIALIIVFFQEGVMQVGLLGQLAPQVTVLLVTVASVIIPGLIFVRRAGASGATDSLRTWIASWQLDQDVKISVIVIGV